MDGVTYYFLDSSITSSAAAWRFYDDGEALRLLSPVPCWGVLHRLHPRYHQLQRLADRSGTVYLNLYYRHLDKFNRIKTVFTILTLPIRRSSTDILEDTCGIGHRDQLAYRGYGCQLHEGRFRETADKIATKSAPPTHRRFWTPWFRLRSGRSAA